MKREPGTQPPTTAPTTGDAATPLRRPAVSVPDTPASETRARASEAPPARPATSAAAIESPRSTVDDSARRRMIREAAYRRYQQRGKAEGSELDDWLQAEAEVDRALGADAPGSSRPTR